MNRDELIEKMEKLLLAVKVEYFSAVSQTELLTAFGGLKYLVQQNTNECKWHQEDHEDNSWYSDCGQSFVLVDGSPNDNKMSYCNKCGNKLIEVFHEDQ